MRGAIIVDQIRDKESISKQTEPRGMLILEQSGVRSSGEKCGRSEQRENITQRERISVPKDKRKV